MNNYIPCISPFPVVHKDAGYDGACGTRSDVRSTCDDSDEAVRHHGGNPRPAKREARELPSTHEVLRPASVAVSAAHKPQSGQQAKCTVLGFNFISKSDVQRIQTYFGREVAASMAPSLSEAENYSFDDLKHCYVFFRSAEKACAKADNPGVDYFIARQMKWVFRAALAETVHRRLEAELDKALDDIHAGGKRNKGLGLRAGVAVTADDSIALFTEIKHASQISHKPTHEIECKMDNSVSFGVKAGFVGQLISAKLAKGWGYQKREKYSNFSEFCRAHASSLKSFYDASKISLGKNIIDILSVWDFEKVIRYSNICQPFLRQCLNVAGIRNVSIHYFTVRRALPSEKSTYLTCMLKAGLKARGMIGWAGLGANVKMRYGEKQKAVDAIDLLEHYPDLVPRFLSLTPTLAPAKISGAEQLLAELVEHVYKASRVMTQSLLRDEPKALVRQKENSVYRDAAVLLRRYAELKHAHYLTAQHEEKLKNCIEHYAVLLRPIHKSWLVQTHSAKQKVKIDFALGSNQVWKEFPVYVNGKMTLAHISDDDPHQAGTYLRLKFFGTFCTLEAAERWLRHGLGKLGLGEDIAALSQKLAGLVIKYEHGLGCKLLFKIKGKTILLLVVDYVTRAKTTTSVAVPGLGVASIKLKLEDKCETLRSQHIGAETLDYILPIARKKLTSQQALAAWQKEIIAGHEGEFMALIDNMRRQWNATCGVLYDELKAMQSVLQVAKAAYGDCVEKFMLDSAREDHAIEALNQLLLMYVKHHLKPFVAAQWQLVNA